ncbi:MAG: hypothetical protein ABEJ60_01380 [Halodesulfurarchaeum sp.]
MVAEITLFELHLAGTETESNEPTADTVSPAPREPERREFRPRLRVVAMAAGALLSLGLAGAVRWRRNSRKSSGEEGESVVEAERITSK